MRLIDADGIIARWRAAILHMVKESDGRHAISMETLIEDLKKSPTIEAEPVKHGRWKNGRCVDCSFDFRWLTDGENDLEQWVWDEGTNYCPNCGAKMDLED